MTCKWMNIEQSLGWVEWVYVDIETQKINSSVKQFGSGKQWYVFKNGAEYGQFMTKEAAMQRAEKI
jgi:hypothetical protein